MGCSLSPLRDTIPAGWEGPILMLAPFLVPHCAAKCPKVGGFPATTDHFASHLK